MEGVLKKELLIPRGGNKARYKHIIDTAVGADTNIELDTVIPNTDAEWLDFFARAVAKEIKLVNSSDRDQFIAPLFPKVSNANSYKRNAGIVDDPDSSNVIFVETMNALYRGHPYDYGEGRGAPYAYIYKDIQTQLFLYYRQSAHGVPKYVGHIFVFPKEIEEWERVEDDDNSFVYFVSIYKSVLEKALKQFSGRVIDDIVAYAKSLEGFTSIVTNPLPGPMEKILAKKGFRVVDRRVPGTFYISTGNYVLQFGGRRRRTRKATKTKRLRRTATR